MAIEVTVKLPDVQQFKEIVPVQYGEQAKSICESKYPNAEFIVITNINA